MYTLYQGEAIQFLATVAHSYENESTEQGLTIFLFSFLFSGYNMFGSGLYTALSNGKVSALIAFSKTLLPEAYLKTHSYCHRKDVLSNLPLELRF